jgi:putative transposase
MALHRCRKRTRLKEYNYCSTGSYFVTICTKKHKCIFGDVLNRSMVLNQFGTIAKNTWLDIPNHHTNVQIDSFVIMPNHLHGIIRIKPFVGNGPARSNANYLSVVIGSYKSSVTRQINRLNSIVFYWQKSFYDHIIRSRFTLRKIQNYIANNPAMWDTDENNPINFK